MRVVLILMMLISFSAKAVYEYDDVERGLLWYDTFGEVEKQEKKKEEKPKPKKPVKKEEKKKVVKKPKPKEKEKKKDDFVFPVRPDAPPVVAQFLKEPNEENAKKFLEWQAKYFNHLRKIGYTLQNTYRKYGYQVYDVIGYPETIQFAQAYTIKYRDEMLRVIFKNLKDKLGLLFFYKARCPYCKEEIPVIEKLMNDYGISVRGISYDEKVNAKFKSVVNPEMFVKYRITGTPTIVAVYVGDNNEVIQGVVGVGFLPLDQLRQNILYFLYSNNLLKPKDLNPNYQFFYNSASMSGGKND